MHSTTVLLSLIANLLMLSLIVASDSSNNASTFNEINVNVCRQILDGDTNILGPNTFEKVMIAGLKAITEQEKSLQQGFAEGVHSWSTADINSIHLPSLLARLEDLPLKRVYLGLEYVEFSFFKNDEESKRSLQVLALKAAFPKKLFLFPGFCSSMFSEVQDYRQKSYENFLSLCDKTKKSIEAKVTNSYEKFLLLCDET